MLEVTIYRGEVKPITIVVTNEVGRRVDLSGATLFLALKRHGDDSTSTILKHHAEFSMGGAVSGSISFTLSRPDSAKLPGKMVGQIRAIISGKSIITNQFILNLKDSIIPGPFVGEGVAVVPAFTP
jgi:hypothetical protein